MDDGDLLRLLTRMNPWWNGDEVQDSLRKAAHRRRDFYKIRELLHDSSRQILTIRGPRQVGKTTLCGQLIESLLIEDMIQNDRILYMTVENSRLLSEPAGKIEQSIELYRENILRKSFRDVDGQIYIFIDEVQKSPDWANTLKYFTDTYSNLNFIATGSISTLIKDEAGDTLIGRMDERIMMPMKFIEYVRYEEIIDEDVIYEESTDLRSQLKQSVKSNDQSSIVSSLTRFYGVYEDIKPQIDALKEKYLLKGGYPGALDEEIDETYQLLDTDLRNTVTGDLCSVFSVEQPQTILQILSLISESAGSKINKSNISDTAGVSRTTVDRYLEYLDEFFLISRCPMYRSSAYRGKGRPKIYMQDVGLYNTLAGTMAESTLEMSTEMGPILETVVCDHSRRLQFYLSGARNANICYWDKQGEVDFVVRGNDYQLPIEVKHGDSTSRDLRGIRNFIAEHDLDFGLCVNNSGILEHDNEVIHIPAWMFLFMC